MPPESTHQIATAAIAAAGTEGTVWGHVAGFLGAVVGYALAVKKGEPLKLFWGAFSILVGWACSVFGTDLVIIFYPTLKPAAESLRFFVGIFGLFAVQYAFSRVPAFVDRKLGVNPDRGYQRDYRGRDGDEDLDREYGRDRHEGER